MWQLYRWLWGSSEDCTGALIPGAAEWLSRLTLNHLGFSCVNVNRFLGWFLFWWFWTLLCRILLYLLWLIVLRLIALAGVWSIFAIAAIVIVSVGGLTLVSPHLAQSCLVGHLVLFLLLTLGWIYLDIFGLEIARTFEDCIGVLPFPTVQYFWLHGLQGLFVYPFLQSLVKSAAVDVAWLGVFDKSKLLAVSNCLVFW